MFRPAPDNFSRVIEWVFPPPMERAGRLFSKLRMPPGTVSPEVLARAAWPEAVGKRIASRTRAASLVRDCLVVEVEDAVWQRQLFVLRGQILKKLEGLLGTPIVNEIEFRVGIPRRLPQRAERRLEPADEAERIEDPLLRLIYKQDKRKRESA